jgi:hypothetical protein
MPKLQLRAPLEYVGKMKYAEMLNLTYREVNDLLQRGVLEPDAIVDGCPAFLLNTHSFARAMAWITERMSARKQKVQLTATSTP